MASQSTSQDQDDVKNRINTLGAEGGLGLGGQGMQDRSPEQDPGPHMFWLILVFKDESDMKQYKHLD